MHKAPSAGHSHWAARPGKAVHHVSTREPGDLPAHRSLLPDPGDGQGTVLRLSDEHAAGAASVRMGWRQGVRLAVRADRPADAPVIRR